MSDRLTCILGLLRLHASQFYSDPFRNLLYFYQDGLIDISALNGYCDDVCDCVLVETGNLCYAAESACPGTILDVALLSNATAIEGFMQAEMDLVKKTDSLSKRLSIVSQTELVT